MIIVSISRNSREPMTGSNVRVDLSSDSKEERFRLWKKAFIRSVFKSMNRENSSSESLEMEFPWTNSRPIRASVDTSWKTFSSILSIWDNRRIRDLMISWISTASEGFISIVKSPLATVTRG